MPYFVSKFACTCVTIIPTCAFQGKSLLLSSVVKAFGEVILCLPNLIVVLIRRPPGSGSLTETVEKLENKERKKLIEKQTKKL